MNDTVYIYEPSLGYLNGLEASGQWEWVPKIKNDNGCFAWGLDIEAARKKLVFVHRQHPDAVIHNRRGKEVQ